MRVVEILVGICLCATVASASPTFEWAETYDGAGNGDSDRATASIVDADGNVILAGPSGESHVGIVKYERTNGQLMWERRVTSSFGAGVGVIAEDMTLDTQGDVLIAGHLVPC
jgi:hypothetical protein